MVVAEYLGQIKRLNMMINNKLVELDQLQTIATSITAQTDKEAVKSSGDQDKLGSAVSKIVDMENEINDLIEEYVSKKKIIMSQINQIEDDRYYNVLTGVYVHNWTLEKVAVSMGYSTVQIKRLLKEAKIEFDRIFSGDFRNMIHSDTI